MSGTCAMQRGELPELRSARLASRAVALGQFLVEFRQFSLSFTEIIELVQGERFSSNAEIYTLAALGIDGARRPNSLAAEIRLTDGGMSNLLDRLEASGLVRRVKSLDGDRRGVAVELTADGEGIVDLTARASTNALTMVHPLLEHWRRRFLDLGFEIGDAPLRLTGHGSNLEQIRRMSAVGTEMHEAFAGALHVGSLSPVTAFHILWLAEHAEGLRPGDVARAEHLSRAAASEAVTRLEHFGLVERVRGAGNDGRAVHVVVTERGRELLAATIDAARPAAERMAQLFFPL